MGSSKFWNFVKTEDAAEIHFYGEIASGEAFGDEITPKAFLEDLDEAKGAKNLDIYINSGGGDVFAGFSIYNMIKRTGIPTTVYVDGLAASAASVVAMAGDRIVMPKNSVMMIHNAWCGGRGNAKDLREQAEKLDRIDGQIAQIYSDRTKKPIEEVKALMEAETWMSADEAFANGFCDEIEENKMVALALGEEFKGMYKNMPEDIQVEQKAEEKQEKIEPEPEQEVEPDGGECQPVGEIEARDRMLSILNKRIKMEE